MVIRAGSDYGILEKSRELFKCFRPNIQQFGVFSEIHDSALGKQFYVVPKVEIFMYVALRKTELKSVKTLFKKKVLNDKYYIFLLQLMIKVLRVLRYS
jgi:hypothetical protein